MSNMNMGPGGGSLRPGGAAPGQMTAVMRAMQVSAGPKVLRIGLVNAGRVLEERVIKNRISVTVGPSEKATFVLAAQQLAPSFKMFELIGNDYYLNFLDGMTGRVALTSGISDLATLRGQAKKVGNMYQIKLSEDARGKVVVGDISFLFQFVAPPPVQPRPQLPLAVQGGFANQIDWPLTIVAAFSFLFHFGLVGLMYSDWMDPPIAESSVDSLVQMMKSIPPPPIEEKVEEKVDPNAAKDKPDDKSAKAAPKAGGGAQAAGPSGPKGSSVSDAKAAAMAQQAQQMEMAMLAAYGGQTATSGALNRSDIPPVDLSGAAKSGAGVTAGNGDLKLGSGGGAMQSGGNGKGGLAGVGGGTGGSGTGAGAGTERAVQGPKGDAQTGGVSASVPVNNADRVIAGLRGRFRSCYQTGLNTDPNMEGKVVIAARVGPNGEVESASVASNTGLSASVAACIQSAVKRAQFDAPGGSGSSLNIPVTFRKQN